MQKKSGFTLIELLVAITIFLLLTSVAMVNYRNLNQRQQLQQSANNLQEALRFAQKKSRVGEKPAGCDSPEVLQGYAVRATATGTTYQLYAVCSNGDFVVGENTPLIGDTTFNLSTNLDLEFKILTGGVNAPVTITLQNQGLLYQFAVNSGGEIEEGDIL